MTEPDRMTITPDQIDAAFVPRPLASVEQAVVGDELVLVDGWRSATVVGLVGSLIWGSFDGHTSLAGIVADLAQATGGDPEVVERDVMAFTTQMGSDGYLEGVKLPEPDWGDTAWVEVLGLAVGEMVDDTEVRALDGTVGSLAELRGRPTLLVNWSPHCGYCWAIADLLAVLVAPLEEAGIQLVLIASGDEVSNREMTKDTGLDATVLLRLGDVDPFRAYGTPSAYHLDADGLLVAPLAGGAESVLDLACELAGVDAYALLDDPDSDPVPPGTRYLLTDGACAPATGDDPKVHWSGIRTYRVGEHHVGIRHDTDATAAVLDALFPAPPVRDRRAGHSYAVALQLRDDEGGEDPGEPADPRNSQVQDLRLLVAGGYPLVRSRYPSRVLRALLWNLADDTVGYATEAGRLRVQATAALIDGKALLLPHQLTAFGGALQARLARVGVAVADPPFPEIDLATAELVVPVPAVEHDPTVLDELDPPVHTGSELPPVRPGRYPLSGWGVLHPGDRAVVHLSPAEAAAATLSLVYETNDAPRRLVELGELFARIQGFGLWYYSEAGLVDAIMRAVRRESTETEPW